MTGKFRFFSLILGALTIGGLIVWQATRSTASLVLTPSELASSGDAKRVRVRMGGRVSAEKISYQTEPSFILSFRIADRDDETRSVPVIYNDIKPDMFAPGRDVLVDGDWVNGIFYAAHLLTQCPSKYEPSLPQTNSETTKSLNHSGSDNIKSDQNIASK